MKPELKPTQALPGDARLAYSFSAVKNRAALWGLNFAAIPMFFFFSFFFLWFRLQLHPSLVSGFPNGLPVSGRAAVVFTISVVVFQLVVHELVHGLFFWLFTHQRPAFGFRGWYAFAGAPGWYFPRRYFLVISLAPLVLISLFCMLLMLILPAGLALAGALFMAVANATGSVGDLWYAVRALIERTPILVEDLGEGFCIYSLP